MDKLYTDLLNAESGHWSLSEISEADYYLLLELFSDDTKKEAKQDPLSFFGTFMSPEDIAKAKGEI
jgi:hypothetical protein